MPAPNEHWHLDKKVPIALFLLLFSLFCGFVVQTVYLTQLITEWKTVTDNRLTSLEKTDDTRSTHENRLVVLEQQFGYIRSDLAEIKELLRRQIPPADSQKP